MIDTSTGFAPGKEIEMARRVVAVAGLLLALLLFTVGPVQADRLGGAYRGPFEDDIQPKEDTTLEVTPDTTTDDGAPQKEESKGGDGEMGTDDPPDSGGDDDDDTSPPPGSGDDGAGMDGGDGGGSSAKPPPGSGTGSGSTGGINPGGSTGQGPGGRVAVLDVLAYWPFWFEHNKEWLLSEHLTSRAAAAMIPIASSTFYFSAVGDTRVLTPVSKEQKERVIFTYLVDAARHGKTAWCRDAAVMAMGKLGIPEVVPYLEERVRLDRDLDVREDALLALGLTRQQAAFKPLMAALGDPRYKSYAALGLGLLGHKEAVGPLLKEYKTAIKARNQQDVAACFAVAIGALADDSHVDALAEPLKRPSGNATLKVFICQALGRIDSEKARKWLIRALSSKQPDVKAAAILSLAEFQDKQVFKVLTGGKTSDRMSKVFTQVALARFAQDLDEKDKMRKFIGNMLRESAEKPQKDIYAAMYAAVGLAMMGDPNSAQFFLQSLESDKRRLGMENRTSMAIALGILGERGAVGLLRNEVRKGEPDMQGYSALALGILGEVGAKDVIRRELESSRGKAQVQRPACWALGLLGDRSDVDLLIKVLKFSGTDKHSVRGAAAIAIGLIGDASAVDKLMKIAKRDRNTSNRAFAIAALGCLIDKDAVPRLPQLFMNTNYRRIKDVPVIRNSLRNL